MKAIFRCKKCLLPNTKPDLHFDNDGVCLACKYQEYYETIDWNLKEKEFLELVEPFQKKEQSTYDCLIAVSGGKDSTYQVYLVTQVAKLKPLLVSFQPSRTTEIGEHNLQNMVDAFNCDLIQLRKSRTYRKLARLGFDVVGDHELPNHVGIYCWPMQMAVNFNIPLVFYGETKGHIGLGRWEELVDDKEVTRSDVEQYIGMNGYRISDMMELDDTIDKKEVFPYIYPRKDDLNSLNVRAINLGYFFRWDFHENIRRIKKYGWKTSDINTEGTFGNWEDLDCNFMPMHQYFKFIKYGFARATDHASYEIRHGRLTKEQAKEYIIEYDWKLPTRHFDEFLEFLDIDYDYFYHTVDRFANPILFSRNKKNEFIHRWDGNLVLERIWYDSFDV